MVPVFYNKGHKNGNPLNFSGFLFFYFILINVQLSDFNNDGDSEPGWLSIHPVVR